jgi:hypothetical protein
LAAAGRRAAFRTRAAGGAVTRDTPPEGIDELWTQVASAHTYGVVRDAMWWRWRYELRPDRPYFFAEARRGGRLVGAAAALCREDLGGTFVCILELLAVDRGAARDLVGALGRAAGPLGAVGIATTALPQTPLYTAARSAGLRVLPRRLEPQPLYVGVIDNLETLPGIASQRWCFAWGDLDHL